LFFETYPFFVLAFFFFVDVVVAAAFEDWMIEEQVMTKGVKSMHYYSVGVHRCYAPCSLCCPLCCLFGLWLCGE
jgi:hypothetical protein